MWIAGLVLREKNQTEVTGIMKKKAKRDIEKGYPNADFVAKLRRLADAIEQGRRFEIRIAGERVYVPVRAQFSIEHERSGDEEEIEFQVKWQRE